MLHDTLRPNVTYNFSQRMDTRTACFSVQTSGGQHKIPINLAPSVLLLIHLFSLYLGEGIFLFNKKSACKNGAGERRPHDSIV